MEWLLVGAALAFAVFVWLRRRRPEPPEDTWVLPPDDGKPSLLARPDAPAAAAPPAAGEPVLDRDFLLHRDRTFDPARWDNTPDAVPDDRGLVGTDGAAEAVEGDLPRVFDRQYLEQRARERDERAGQDKAEDA